jgi:hypothetical protein
LGFIHIANLNTAGYPEEEDEPKEDLILNALVWIASKIINFIGARDSPYLAHTTTITIG